MTVSFFSHLAYHCLFTSLPCLHWASFSIIFSMYYYGFLWTCVCGVFFAVLLPLHLYSPSPALCPPAGPSYLHPPFHIPLQKSRSYFFLLLCYSSWHTLREDASICLAFLNLFIPLSLLCSLAIFFILTYTFSFGNFSACLCILQFFLCLPSFICPSFTQWQLPLLLPLPFTLILCPLAVATASSSFVPSFISLSSALWCSPLL